jgi:hypothetical protein
LARGRRVEDFAGRDRVLRNHRPILFYESFNHRAEILALLKDSDYLVFEYDRHQAIVPEVTNFIVLPNDLAPSVIFALAALGDPIPSPRG